MKLGAPVTTSLGGKSSFPENHPLSLGSGGNAVPKPVHHFVQKADVIIGIGCSFTETNFGIKFPRGKTFIHATLDPNHLNKDVVSFEIHLPLMNSAVAAGVALELESTPDEQSSALPH